MLVGLKISIWVFDHGIRCVYANEKLSILQRNRATAGARFRLGEILIYRVGG